jgi:CheY-like chemotaxis protein
VRSTEQPVASILVVEDSDEDFSALARTLRRHPALPELEFWRCTRAEEAFARLEACGRTDENRRDDPALIVLDLDLPGLDGSEVLKRVRVHPTWKNIPVVIFSTAASASVVSWCYEHGANAYQTKDVNYASFKRSVEALASYWFEFARLPRRVDLPTRPPGSSRL